MVENVCSYNQKSWRDGKPQSVPDVKEFVVGYSWAEHERYVLFEVFETVEPSYADTFQGADKKHRPSAGICVEDFLLKKQKWIQIKRSS